MQIVTIIAGRPLQVLTLLLMLVYQSFVILKAEMLLDAFFWPLVCVIGLC